ncbi:DUF7716 domain-containing protein [Corynebacterium sp. A21]|uniref:DUF7716 domain-containing protein n=1 Tax=Corynebacterium sp. A21 TaxID=3457318 RepID=UPI003FD2224A
MRGGRQLIDPDEIMSQPMRLSALLKIFAARDFEQDMCTIFTARENTRAVDYPICTVDDPVLVDDNLQETLPAYATDHGLDMFCHVYDVVDTIANTYEQQPDADMDTLLKNLDYFLMHDTWMDLDGDSPTL